MVTWLRSPFRWRVSTLAGSWGRATRPSRRDPGEDGGRQGRPHGRSDGMFAVPYFIGPKVYQSLWGSITGEWSIMILWFAEWQVLFGGKTGNVSLIHVARSILYMYGITPYGFQGIRWVRHSDRWMLHCGYWDDLGKLPWQDIARKTELHHARRKGENDWKGTWLDLFNVGKTTVHHPQILP